MPDFRRYRPVRRSAAPTRSNPPGPNQRRSGLPVPDPAGFLQNIFVICFV